MSSSKENNDRMLSLSNDKEFQCLFDHYYVPLCVFADKYLDNKDLSADVVQDCFLKLWQIRKDFFYLHQVKSFLYIAVRNCCLNELEHLKVVNEFAQKIIRENEEAFFHDHVVEEETYRILVDRINQLPRQMRTIMLLALEGMSNATIAEEMNISTETVRSLKKIAYKKLRTLLKDYYYLLVCMI